MCKKNFCPQVDAGKGILYYQIANTTSLSNQNQGDQIGRIFAYWSIVSFGQFFERLYG
jgi:hypothetical protein